MGFLGGSSAGGIGVIVTSVISGILNSFGRFISRFDSSMAGSGIYGIWLVSDWEFKEIVLRKSANERWRRPHEAPQSGMIGRFFLRAISREAFFKVA
jgi:hypothetical protein